MTLTPRKQTLLVPPAEGESIRTRCRQLNGQTLETKRIVDILIRHSQRVQDYLVRVDDGTSHVVKHIGQNPKFLLFHNDQPLSTCGVNYVPLFNDEIKQCATDALAGIGRTPVSIDEAEDGYRWRMKAVLDVDFEVPLGHLRQNDKFDWGIGITNSYDLSEGIHVYMYIYRQICSNGLFAWSVSGRKNFIHVEKELDHDAILNKITDGIATIVEEHGSFFGRLDEMSKVIPSREQAKLLAKRLGVRKYEAALLADRGLFIEYHKSEIKDVTMDNKINSEYDLLNALTSMSQNTNSMRRQLDIQTGLMEKILQARTIVPAL